MKQIVKVLKNPICCDYYYADEKRGNTYCSLNKKYTVCPPKNGKFPKECPLEDYKE